MVTNTGRFNTIDTQAMNGFFDLMVSHIKLNHC